MIGVNRWKIYTINYAFVIYTPNGENAIVHVNNMIDFANTIEHSILCTNQARINWGIISDISSNIEHKSKQNIEFPYNDLEFTLQFEGPVPYLNARYPTVDDIQTVPHLNVTSTEPWNPEHITIVDKNVAALDFPYTQDDSSWLSNAFNISNKQPITAIF